MMQWTTAMSKQYVTHFSLGASKRYNLGFMDKYVRRFRRFLIVADALFRYLISRLNLDLPSYTEARLPRSRVKLHRLQNALSELVAAYFWSSKFLQYPDHTHLMNPHSSESGKRRQPVWYRAHERDGDVRPSDCPSPTRASLHCHTYTTYQTSLPAQPHVHPHWLLRVPHAHAPQLPPRPPTSVPYEGCY